MPQSLSKIYIHLVFSTKGRTDTIPKQHPFLRPFGSKRQSRAGEGLGEWFEASSYGKKRLEMLRICRVNPA